MYINKNNPSRVICHAIVQVSHPSLIQSRGIRAPGEYQIYVFIQRHIQALLGTLRQYSRSFLPYFLLFTIILLSNSFSFYGHTISTHEVSCVECRALHGIPVPCCPCKIVFRISTSFATSSQRLRTTLSLAYDDNNTIRELCALWLAIVEIFFFWKP